MKDIDLGRMERELESQKRRRELVAWTRTTRPGTEPNIDFTTELGCGPDRTEAQPICSLVSADTADFIIQMSEQLHPRNGNSKRSDTDQRKTTPG